VTVSRAFPFLFAKKRKKKREKGEGRKEADQAAILRANYAAVTPLLVLLTGKKERKRRKGGGEEERGRERPPGMLSVRGRAARCLLSLLCSFSQGKGKKEGKGKGHARLTHAATESITAASAIIEPFGVKEKRGGGGGEKKDGRKTATRAFASAFVSRGEAA